MRRIISFALATATVVTMAGAIAPVANAQSAAALQAQIAALLAQIQQLQGQLGQSGSASSAYSYTRDLTVGSKGADVTALQEMLIAGGYLKVSATGYFGSLTKAAVAAWQSAVGLTPAAGYFGPKSRAYLASSGSGSGSTGSTGGTITAPAGGLAVSLAASNPSAGSLISSGSSAAARVPVLAVNYTAGSSSGVTISEIKFHKNGVLSDSAISGAYLVENGKVVAQYSSVSGGVVDFAGLSLSVAAGQTRTLWLAIDPATGLSAGNTVSFSLASAADITSVDASNNAITESGNFPMNGNIFTVTSVSNPSLASMTIASSSVGTSVYAGTQGVLVSQWSLTVNNNPVKLSSINFRVVGSANKSDLRNVKLFANGAQVGSTLASVGADGNAYFDLSGSPVTLPAGSGNLQLFADVMGSPSFNFQFEVLNSYDVYAIDTQYNVPVAVTVNGGSGVQVSIKQGQITVTSDTGTPTGNVAKGGSGVTLAKFDIYAAGEAVKVKFLDVDLITGSAGQVTGTLQNIYLVDDAGVQIGSTINTPAEGTSSGQCTNVGTATATCHFGTSSSNINYVVPANTTRVISVKASILSTATASTIQSTLPGNSSNLQGVTSSQSASSGAANGATLTIASTPLTVTKNTALGTVSYAKGTTGAKIGSFTLSANSAEGVNVSNLTITMGASSTDFQNLKVKVGSTQIGSTQATMAGSDSVGFSGNISIPAGGTVTVDVYADVLSSASAQTITSLTTFASCTGSGATTNAADSCSPTSVAGQNVTVGSGAALTASIDATTPSSGQIVMGNNGQNLAVFRLNETSNVENAKLTDMIVTDTVTSGATAGFNNVGLYNGSTLLANAPATSTNATTYTYSFHLSTPFVVNAGSSALLTVKGDIAPYGAGASTDNAAHALKLVTTSTDVTARGSSSNSTVAITFGSNVTGNTLTVLRSKLTLAGVTVGPAGQNANVCGSSGSLPANFSQGTVGRQPITPDIMGCLQFNASTGADITLNTINLKILGGAVTGTFNVDLIDPATNAKWNSVTTASCVAGASTSCTASFTFASAPVISAGTSKVVAVQVAAGGFTQGGTSGLKTAQISVNANTDVVWQDSTTSGLNLEATAAPLTFVTVGY